MPFLRIGIDNHEWGFRVANGFIPAVGDRIELWYAQPDECANDYIGGTVVGRRWGFASDIDKYDDIWILVELDFPVPDGFVADSTEWPSEAYSERRAALLDDLIAITKGSLTTPSPERETP